MSFAVPYAANLVGITRIGRLIESESEATATAYLHSAVLRCNVCGA